jgi:hypothetical protein
MHAGNMQRVFLALLLLSSLACGRSFDATENAIQRAIENVSCPQGESYLFDVFYKNIESDEEFPTQDKIRDILSKSAEEVLGQEKSIEPFVESFDQFIQLINKSFPNSIPEEKIKWISRLEIGDRSDPEIERLSQKVLESISEIQKLREVFPRNCGGPIEQPPVPPAEQNQTLRTSADLVSASQKIIITAYQSCQAVLKTPLTTQTPNILGIIRSGIHPDGVGAQRSIANLQEVQRTHYYLQGTKTTPRCFDTSPDPLIYDYGGKPFATSDDSSDLDLFREAGSGTSVRGIDCSAFIFSSIARAGFKLNPDKKMRAILVNGVSSTMFVDPQRNGLTCFEPASLGFKQSLREGDIIAIPGHIVLVDQVGSDPLGLQKVTSSQDCQKLSYKKFDFTISQSSSSKNGIGINRFKGRDYLQSTTTFRSAMEAAARQICEASIKKQQTQLTNGKIQISRISSNPRCQNTPIRLVAEECAQSCP